MNLPPRPPFNPIRPTFKRVGRIRPNDGELHPSVIARRFNEIFLHLRRFDENLTVSQLAEVLGYRDSRFLDQLSLGSDHITFEELDDFAQRAALSADWLKHGAGTPFELSFSFEMDIKALLANLLQSPHERIYAIRSDNQFSSVCIACRKNKLVYTLHSTTIHLSKEVGATGSRHLQELYEALVDMQSVRKVYPISITLPDKVFKILRSGTTFPGFILNDYRDCHWADDYVDLADYDELTYRRLVSHGQEYMDAVAIVRSRLRNTGNHK